MLLATWSVLPATGLSVSAVGKPLLSPLLLIAEEVQLLRLRTIAPAIREDRYFLRRFITKKIFYRSGLPEKLIPDREMYLLGATIDLLMSAIDISDDFCRFYGAKSIR